MNQWGLPQGGTKPRPHGRDSARLGYQRPLRADRAPRSQSSGRVLPAAPGRAVALSDELTLFGTAARGEDRPDSDIDLLVNLAPGKSLLDLARMEISLEELLQRPVDVVTLGALTEPMRSTVLSDAIDV